MEAQLIDLEKLFEELARRALDDNFVGGSIFLETTKHNYKIEIEKKEINNLRLVANED